MIVKLPSAKVLAELARAESAAREWAGPARWARAQQSQRGNGTNAYGVRAFIEGYMLRAGYKKERGEWKPERQVTMHE